MWKKARWGFRLAVGLNSMTRLDLENQANAILIAAKATVELQGDFPMTILLHKSGEWRHLPFPEEASDLLNDGTAKDLIFGAVREIVQSNQIDGVIFATDTWIGEATPEGLKHYDTPEWKELHDFGFVRLVQRGWVTRNEAFTITAQSATDVLVVQQTYQRLGSGMIQLFGGKRNWFDQSKFGGRQKMFGDLNWKNLGSEGATKGAPQPE